MVNDLRITVLVENTARGPNLLSEHGLAFWIEADGSRILFDTGQGKVLRNNATQLGISLNDADMVVISHGHYDHTGGLKELVNSGEDAIDVYLHPAALDEKFHREKSPPHRSIGIARFDERTLQALTRSVKWTCEPTMVMNGVHATGPIPRKNDFEDAGGPFFTDPDCTKPDLLSDDQAMYVETRAGLVVVLGCAHAGIVNTLDYIAELSGRQRVHAVLGGMHLLRATSRRMEATVDSLRQHGVQAIGAAHCTGMRAKAYLWSQFRDECFECSTGTIFSVHDGVSKYN